MKYKSRIFNRFEFSHKFLRFLLVDRIVIKKDNLILITGKRGDGKTTLALKLILGFSNFEEIEEQYNKEINRKNEDKENKEVKLVGFKPFVLDKDMAFTRKGLQDLCKNTTRGFILADEAIVNAAKRNSMTKANKILHEVLTINRKNFNTIFFCLPSVEDFDVSILQYVTHWIHIDDRGIACVMLPDSKSIFGRKSWDIDKMKKIFDKFREENPNVVSVPYWLFNNFRGYLRFKALPQAIEEEYLSIANEKKNEDTQDEKKKEKPVEVIPDAKKELLNKIVDELLEGKIVNTEDYYMYCGDLGFKRDKLNKEVAEILASRGDGRNAAKVMKANRDAIKAKEEKAKLDKRILY